jgi:hypothetical protein
MQLPHFMRRSLSAWAERVMESRAPDFIIGERSDPYMLRWYAIPRNRFFNLYLHRVLRSDDDRALHDHPWLNASIILRGAYIEHTISAGGIEVRSIREAGAAVARRARAAHRLEVVDGRACETLFITGPRVREWGFHCPATGWRHWRIFTAGPNGETVGKGCE